MNKRSEGAFEAARNKMIITCHAVARFGGGAAVVGFLVGILLGALLGWPIYGFFVGTGIGIGAFVAGLCIKRMPMGRGESFDGAFAFSRAMARSLGLFLAWLIMAVIFELVDERLGIDPGHVHVIWVVALGAAAASFWLFLVALVRFANPFALKG